MTVLIISGLPATGKGTQCKKVAADFGLAHLDTGDYLRHEIDRGSELGKEAKEYISKGKLVPNSVVQEAVDNMLKKRKNTQGVIFDGFPRTKEQAEILEKLCDEYNLKLQGMIYLDVEENEMIKRIKTRAEQDNRKDDQDPTIIKQRIDEQKKQLKGLIDYFKERNMLYKVDGNGSKEQVYENIKSTIDAHQLVRT